MVLKIVHRIPVVRMLVIRPRLAFALLVGIVTGLLLPDSYRPITKLLTAWDIGIALYLVLAAGMMGNSDNAKMRHRASLEDEGGLILLGLTVFGAVASLAAIMHELVIAKTLSGHGEGLAIALAAATVVLSWLFMQTMFALHYAHEFYKADTDKDGNGGGLEFPAHYHTPDYWDFVYFSFVIGTAAATADINLTSRMMRRIVTLHCIVVFFFNTSILALAINIGAGLAS